MLFNRAPRAELHKAMNHGLTDAIGRPRICGCEHGERTY